MRPRSQISNMNKKGDRLKELIDNEWLQLGDVSELVTVSPLRYKSDFDRENPHIHLLKVMMNPDYFHYTCKAILNLTIMPMQSVILKELWIRKYPILTATRGGGKCISGDSLLQTDKGLLKFEEIIDPSSPIESKVDLTIKVLGETRWNQPEYGWNNGESATLKIRTKYGYEIEGTLNHPIRVIDANGELIWKELLDIKVGDTVPIHRKPHKYNSEQPIDNDLAWWLGATIGDGMTCQKAFVSFYNIDRDIISNWRRIGEKISQLKVCIRPSSKFGYYINSRSFNQYVNETLGLGYKKAHDKEIPKCIRIGGTEAIGAFLGGLWDTDGTVTKSYAQLSTVSELMSKQVQSCLLSIGIISRRKTRWTSCNGKRFKNYTIAVSGSANVKKFYTLVNLRCHRKRKKILKITQKIGNTNRDLIPPCMCRRDMLAIRSRISASKLWNCGDYKTVSAYAIKTYKTSYPYARKFLRFAKSEKHTQEWKQLANLYKKNYFYDTVESITTGTNVTYDVYIPNDHSFISNGFISHNSFILAVYAILRALLQQGSKIVFVGAAFRQSKLLFEYCENIWNNAPVLRSMVDPNDRTQKPRHDIDRCMLRIGQSTIIAIPIGTGEKVRGVRATHLISDEFSSIPEEIYETVISGFAAVAADPVEKVKAAARRRKMIELGLWDHSLQTGVTEDFGNQAILSGTASYEFNHFAKYWKRYKAIVESKGSERQLLEIFNGEIPPNFDWRHYSVIRIPADLMPEGFMDAAHIGRSKATVHIGIYQMEYQCIFVSDSQGFFRRSLIESCVTTKPIEGFPVSGSVKFSPRLSGDRSLRYVYGVDPASEADSFAISIVELHPDHRRLVYAWTTNRNQHKDLVKQGKAGEADFYQFCTRKLRKLMKVFPCERIIVDSQGGGRAISEALHDTKRLEVGELPIWEVVDYDNPKDSDGYMGEHKLVMATFSRAEWTSDANHGMRRDFENKQLLFPFFDSIALAFAAEDDKAAGRDIDTLEDCVMEIEETKNELATIVMTQTGIQGRDRWDTPEIKTAGGRKGRMRKDRYSALLMANMVARTIQSPPPITNRQEMVGGFANVVTKMRDDNTVMYIGSVPPEMAAAYGNMANFGAVVKRSN